MCILKQAIIASWNFRIQRFVQVNAEASNEKLTAQVFNIDRSTLHTWRQALPQDHPCRINGNLQTNQRRQADMAQEMEVLKKNKQLLLQYIFFLITLLMYLGEKSITGRNSNYYSNTN